MRYDAAMKKLPSDSAVPEAVTQLLAGITIEVFLREYWQKKPLLIRQAIPGFQGLLSPEELAGLACEEAVQSRLVMQREGKWTMECGPMAEQRFGELPDRDWTLLVQELNHHLPEAAALLQRFDFIPYARLDDLMVSYAPEGGGVGPHFDSYDVFLLQGQGKRRWRISEQRDLMLVEGVPLRILKHFETEEEFVLEAGDMLYLPPHVAHWGIAVGDCMTYSIGFRAPSAQELATQFLVYLQDRVNIPGMYADPDLALQTHPAEIGKAMTARVAAMLAQISWRESDIADFLAHYLSEPKPHVVFQPPRSMSLAAFHKKLQKQGIALDGKSQLLFHGARFFINGEMIEARPAELAVLQQLADRRRLPAAVFADMLLDMKLIDRLHAWYAAGYLQWA